MCKCAVNLVDQLRRGGVASMENSKVRSSALQCRVEEAEQLLYAASADPLSFTS